MKLPSSRGDWAFSLTFRATPVPITRPRCVEGPSPLHGQQPREHGGIAARIAQQPSPRGGSAVLSRNDARSRGVHGARSRDMKSLGLSRYALAIGAASALLAGCGGSQPPIGAPGAMPQSRATTTQARHGKSWMMPEAKRGELDIQGEQSEGGAVIRYR